MIPDFSFFRIPVSFFQFQKFAESGGRNAVFARHRGRKMNRWNLSGLAVILGLMMLIIPNALTAQGKKKTNDIKTGGGFHGTATVAPTVQRIKSLKLPAGFSAAKFAEIANPRMLAVSAAGTVYVSQRSPGTLSMLKDTNGDGVADVQKVVAEKEMMHGVAIDGNKIYLVTVKEVLTADIKPDGTLGELKLIIDDLPEGGQHPNRTIAVRNGKLFITVGSTCNACDETNPENASIVVMDPDGKNRKIYASGLRNTIGFGWHPGSNRMFGMDHGIDWLGDDEQPEELNEIIEGEKYGWAYVYADGKINPQDSPPAELGLTSEDWAAQSKEPVLMYTAHAAPMQMVFYTGAMFPAEYKNDAFVAFRGSWNRAEPSGYEVVRIHFNDDGTPTKFEPFLTGFLIEGSSPEGKEAHFARIAGIAQSNDGSLLVADDTNSIIYRIAYNEKTMPPIMAREDIASNLPETANAPKTIEVESSAFNAGGTMPDKFSAYFQGVSPELAWSNVPANAKSLVLMMEDPDASLKPVTHWLVANISPNVTGFPENVRQAEKYGDAVQGANHTGKIGYYGPMPPPGEKPHEYHFQIFALDKMLDLPAGYNRQALLDAIKGHVIAKGELVGMYQRKPDVRKKN
jgi:Raf kinase inhibitor-like YbhB/YbcL family protein